ncbi:MAG: hypothetical protein AAB590_00040 [Patescibacteria group bacterium]
MAEGLNLEQEIADLSAQIEAKRSQLERERGGTVESREALHHVVGEKISQQAPSFNPTSPMASRGKSSSASYLDDLDPADIEQVNALIDLIPKLGINRTIEQAKDLPAYVLDAFHDALVDKLGDELKKQNLI